MVDKTSHSLAAVGSDKENFVVKRPGAFGTERADQNPILVVRQKG